LYPEEKPVSQKHYGVAIDRVTGAVAQGPFNLETVTEGSFAGIITLRNFTLGQFGLLAAALLDVGDGLVPLGFGKSRGLGRVDLAVVHLAVRTLRDPGDAILGTGALCDERTREAFDLPVPERERLPSSAEQRLCRRYLDAEIALLDPALILPVGRLAIGLFYPVGQPLEEIIGTQKQVDGRWVVPRPHPSGASRWHQSEDNRARVRKAVALIGEHVQRLFTP
jgi:hypothetical protein